MKVLCFGEILFDVFPYGARLGGAPLNVAYHLKKLGDEAVVISALGEDELGEEARRTISSLGINTEYINRSSYPTGRADIILSHGNADYTFNFPSAWDDIRIESAKIDADVLYFGTLAQRSKTSRGTVESLIDEFRKKEIFFDVNLRKKFYTEEILLAGLDAATMLKMNDEEEPVILGMVGAKNIEELSRIFNISTIIITKGKDGSAVYYNDKWYEEKAVNTAVVDTVGAGDSLSAAFIHTFVRTKDVELALRVGSMLAGFVVSKEGALPIYDSKIENELFTLLQV